MGKDDICVSGGIGSGVRAIESTDGTLVWAYSVDKINASRGEQSTAESVAEHMKGEVVESGKK